MASISAVLDQNIVSVNYEYESTSGVNTPVDLHIKLKHAYKMLGQDAEIVLLEFDIDKSQLKLGGLSGSTTLTQKVDFTILNPRYMDNLIVVVEENRGSLVVNEVPVLIGEKTGDYNNIDALPDNPIKDEFKENLPLLEPEKPKNNVASQNPLLNPYIFNWPIQPFMYEQISNRIVYDLHQDPPMFRQMQENVYTIPVFSENSIDNLVPNPQFDPNAAGSAPDFWKVSATGFSLNTKLSAGQVENTNIFSVKVSNTSWMNAFNTVKFEMINPAGIGFSPANLTASVYIKVKSSTVNSVKIRFKFFDSSNNEVGDLSNSCPATPFLDDWMLIQFTVPGSSVPIAASTFKIYFEFELDGPDMTSIDFYLPQVEDTGVATSRVLLDRVQDKYVINTNFALPALIKINTPYIDGYGIRGICDTTTSLKNGFTFAIANNKLNFRFYNPTGVQLYNLFSPIFSASGNTEFGVYVENTQIKMYVNQNLLSSHAVSLTGYEHNGRMVVGSLDSSNKTLNSEILGFSILKEDYV